VAAFNRIYGVKDTAEQQAISLMFGEKLQKGEDVTSEDIMKVHERFQPRFGVEAGVLERERQRRAEAGEPAMTAQEEAELLNKSRSRGGVATENREILDQAKHERNERAKETTDDGKPKYTTQELNDWEAARRGELKTKGAGLSGSRKDDLQSRDDQLKYAMSDMEKIQKLLKKHNFITGIGGKILRPAESIASAMGSNSDDWHEFESLITQLKQRETRLALDVKARPLAGEREYVDKIVRGLNFGDTKTITADRIMHLFTDFKQYREDVQKRLGGGGASGAAPAAKPEPAGEPAWKRAPLVGGDKRSEIETDDAAA
jgi:hypothetical protein